MNLSRHFHPLPWSAFGGHFPVDWAASFEENKSSSPCSQVFYRHMHSVKHPYQEHVKNFMRFYFITLRDVLLTLYLKIVGVAKNSNMASGKMKAGNQ